MVIEAGCTDIGAQLTGVPNFRDVGGCSTQHGRQVRAGLLYRSATFSDVSDAEIALLDSLGIRQVCDLRAAPERSRRVSRWPNSDVTDLWWRDEASSVGSVADAILAPGATAEAVRHHMLDTYRALPFAQAPSFRAVIDRLINTDGPMLVHCSIGKDRTGVLVALILDMLGVSEADVKVDYLRSAAAFEPLCRFVLAGTSGQRFAPLDPAIWAPMIRADSDYLDAAFAAIAQRHGSRAAYRRDLLGIDDASVDRLRARMLA